MMDFLKKSKINPVSTTEETEIEKEHESLPNTMSGACHSAFRVLEATVEDNVKTLKSGGEELAKTLEEQGQNFVTVAEQGARIVNDSVNLAGTGVDNIKRWIKMCQNVYFIAIKYKRYLEADSIYYSTLALALWIFICYVFQTWMIPATILVILLKNHIQRLLLGIPASQIEEMLREDEEKSIKEKLDAVEEIISCIKNIMADVERILEKIFEVFDVYLPHLFWIVVFVQFVMTIVLMYIPVNYLLMFWGINLYLKRFLNNNATTPKKNVLDVISARIYRNEIQDSKSEASKEHTVDGKVASKCE